MSGDNQETASHALRELAQWVVHDGIDSDHLDGYMQRLLSARLVELHAACRVQAMVVARRFPGLEARDVAFRLCETAREIERTIAPHGELPAIQFDCHAAESRPEEIRPAAEHASYVPEFVVSVLLMVVGVGFLMNWPDALFPGPIAGSSDWGLQLTVGVAYIFLSLVSAYEGLCRLWWSFRSHQG